LHVAVEKRKELVILALADRIILVIVALGAADGQTQEHFARGIHAIDYLLDAELLGVHTPFLIRQRVAVEAGRDSLVLRGIWKKIAGKCSSGKAIERNVVVGGLYAPTRVAPTPRPAGFLFITIGIGVGGHVEPMRGPALAVMRTGEQAIDEP